MSCLRGLVPVLTFTALATSSAAASIIIDGVLNGAIDQPRINAIVKVPGAAAPLDGTGIDFETFEEVPTYNIQGFFDTGASTVLLADSIASDFGIPLGSGTFEDAGVAGTETFNITEPLIIQLAPYAPLADIDNPPDPDNINDPVNTTYFDQTYNHVYGPIRAISGPHNDVLPGQSDPLSEILALLSQVNVLGMPMFEGKTVVMDGRSLNDFVINGLDLTTLVGFPQVNTFVYDSSAPPPFDPGLALSNPGVPPTDVHIQMTYVDFTDFTSTSDGAEPPALAHNPFIGPNPLVSGDAREAVNPGATIGLGGLTGTGSLLFDTGAAATIISEQLAGEVGVRYRAGNEPGSVNPLLETLDGSIVPDQFKLTIGGIGGQVQIAGFELDSLEVPTIEGGDKNLEYLNVPVLVLDISIADPRSPPENPTVFTLDGIFGMNMLFATIFVEEPLDLLGIGSLPLAPGAFEWVVFDEPSGVLGLNFIPEFVPEPGTLVLLIATTTVVGIRRRAR